MMRKIEKQAMVQAAKAARKQQGKQALSIHVRLTTSSSPSHAVCKPNFSFISAIMAAEERRKKREQLKILKQQVRILLLCVLFNFPCYYLQLLSTVAYSEFVDCKVKRF